jgi:hypothetical protein
MRLDAGKLGASAWRRLLPEERREEPAPAEAAVERVQWEYRAVGIAWDEEKQAYTAEFSDVGLLVGVGSILSRYGDQGWVLVNFVPNSWADGRVTIYYAVFMRRR